MAEYRNMTIEMYGEVIELWRRMESIGLSEDDEKECIEIFLKRNEALSFVAIDEEVIIGAVLCGHDGRRGAIYHLAVDNGFRRQGIAKKLLTLCIEGLNRVGIRKCSLVAFADNMPARELYLNEGWTLRNDLQMFSKYCYSCRT